MPNPPKALNPFLMAFGDNKFKELKTEPTSTGAEKSFLVDKPGMDVLIALLDTQIKVDLDRACLLRSSVPTPQPGAHNGYHPNQALAQAFLDQAHMLTILAIKLAQQR